MKSGPFALERRDRMHGAGRPQSLGAHLAQPALREHVLPVGHELGALAPRLSVDRARCRIMRRSAWSTDEVEPLDCRRRLLTRGLREAWRIHSGRGVLVELANVSVSLGVVVHGVDDDLVAERLCGQLSIASKWNATRTSRRSRRRPQPWQDAQTPKVLDEVGQAVGAPGVCDRHVVARVDEEACCRGPDPAASDDSDLHGYRSSTSPAVVVRLRVALALRPGMSLPGHAHAPGGTRLARR